MNHCFLASLPLLPQRRKRGFTLLFFPPTNHRLIIGYADGKGTADALARATPSTAIPRVWTSPGTVPGTARTQHTRTIKRNSAGGRRRPRGQPPPRPKTGTVRRKDRKGMKKERPSVTNRSTPSQEQMVGVGSPAP